MKSGVEFDCVECGRSIIRIVSTDTERLCAECLWLPGWFNEPEIAALLDPYNDRKPPPHEVTAT